MELNLQQLVVSGKRDYEMTEREFFMAWHNSTAFRGRLVLANEVALSLMSSFPHLTSSETYDLLYSTMIGEAKKRGLIGG